MITYPLAHMPLPQVTAVIRPMPSPHDMPTDVTTMRPDSAGG